jgi:ribosomal protein S27AE
MRILVGLLGVAVMIFLFTLGNDDEAGPKVCPSCGTQNLYSHYMGHGKPLQWACTRCGYVHS